ncbi:Fanconi anemia group G protein isoform X2 [Hemicordylus capensis]|uniref:Fanconi anemia group G protein isoform X2 n=1 Tax=Hemicordylus capensis TaxID=884348 RepID=UPI002302D9B3|nr:Fanconi anemia group G protein isoform X2 [Hemicordylus capensis]
MAAGGSCLHAWREENDALAGRWRRVTSSPGPDGSVKQAAQQCQLAFTQLLQKIQGLPAALAALPLELTVLCNSLLLDIGLASDCREKLLARIGHGLGRVLEARAVSGQGLSLEESWRRVLQEGTPEELHIPLQRLATLQGVLWLSAASHLGMVERLFRLLSGAKAWHPPDGRESDPLLVQSVRDLKDMLWTSAAFLQGFQEVEAGNFTAALALLQAAATGLCSKRVLAQIFTLMGCCHLRMGKPQTAIQHLKRALQVDFSFLPALYQAALLYHQLGLTGAELEALALLYQALDDSTQVTTESISPHFLIRTELLTGTPQLTAFYGLHHPLEVKYLLAQRCLQAGRASEAVEHYLDLLAQLHEGPLHQVCRSRDLALPRVPEVFLEAAAALGELARHQDAIALCEEVFTRTSRLIPERLRIDLSLSAGEDLLGPAGSSPTESPRGFRQRERESLRCLLWRAASCLLQGWAWAALREAKEAISHFSRCLNDLLRVQFVNTGSHNSPEEEVAVDTALLEARAIPQIRQLALTGRGTQFLEMGRDKEALMDFQHSLHTCPDSLTVQLYLLYTLWKLHRRQEAAVRWQEFCSNPGQKEEEAKRPFPLYLCSCVKQMEFPHVESLTRNLESCLAGCSQGP